MVGRASRFLARQVKESFEKKDRRRLDNLWTGYGLSKKGKRIALTGALGTGGYYVVTGMNQYEQNTAMSSMNPDPSPLPTSMGDQDTYERPDITLGARGDLVFALHNLRNGG